MVSVITSASTATAVSSLRSITKMMEQTQNRIATGLKVSSASDDASVWATAQTVKSEGSAFDAIKGGIALAKAKVDVTAASVNTIADLLTQMRDKATAAINGSDASASAAAITSLQTQIKAAISNATFKSTNLLDGTGGNQTVTIGFDGTAALTTTVTATDAYKSGSPTTGYLGGASGVLDTSVTSATNFTTFLGTINTAITANTTYAAALGGYSKSLDTQVDLLTKINDIRTTAVGALIDADMEKESAKVQALQVRQQLAYQALSMSNASAQNILRLFQ